MLRKALGPSGWMVVLFVGDIDSTMEGEEMASEVRTKGEYYYQHKCKADGERGMTSIYPGQGVTVEEEGDATKPVPRKLLEGNNGKLIVVQGRRRLATSANLFRFDFCYSVVSV